MPRAARLAVLAIAACGGGTGGPAADGGGAAAPAPRGGPPGLAELLQRYEAGTLARADLVAQLASFPASPRADELRGAIDEIVLVRARPMPYAVAAATQIGSAGALVIEPGASIVLGAGVTLEVRGRLYALGTRERPIAIGAASRETANKTLVLAGGRSELVGVTMRFGEHLVTVQKTGKTPILIEASRLDDWRLAAVEMDGADALLIRDSEIGVDTRPENARSEALHGTQSAVRVERNVFGRRAGYNDVIDLQPCTDGHYPVIAGNRFLGGDDDAIDLDTCHAIVVGNHFKDFRPGPTAAGEANGGGVTGAGDTRPLVVGNLIENCVHAIGFKDGARPLLLNNTIVGNDIGLTLYSAGEAPAGNAIAIGNVFWNNKTDLQLDGSWFRAYHPTKKGTLEASHNMLRDAGFAGRDDNLADDPRIELRDGVPHLGAGSPARGSGLGDVAALATRSYFPADALRTALEKDFLGTVRPFADGRFVGIDRGAIQSK
jgi:hypothetical protein